MSVLAGKDGAVYLGANKIGYLDTYSLSIEQGTTETSKFDDQWKEFIGTAKGWSGSFSGTFDYADTDGQKAIIDDLIGNGGEVTLAFKTSMNLILIGDAQISNASVGGSHGDKITISFNFQGSDGFTKKMAAPTFRVEPYSSIGYKVSMNAGAGATIFYTTNGDDPTEEDNEYSQSIFVAQTVTFKAIAVMDGYENSDVASITVTVS